MMDDYDDLDDAAGCLVPPLILLLYVVFIVVWIIIQ